VNIPGFSWSVGDDGGGSVALSVLFEDISKARQ
jgi:hypothetical protein